MKLSSLADRVLDRLLATTTATAGCAPDPWTRCVVNGVCSGGHEKQNCYFRPDCTVSCSSAGCC
ncbi:hypothetical protein FB566_3379 [Stackebrandtia endophytica]|uniref:Uncharacterized protein n=1 Tax=Stackebrandtia endophytica TaxID=1496996 RepID=A0A543AZ11_9ACTN|nr:hypothetical protein [Stackebrandtia endophytica]TQL77812.1 hypothetical protein FB566_3379 [Stackebrandtia endophytica]